MRVACRTPFVDTSADDLTWTLDHPPITPLAARELMVGGHRVELRVLGASHQVLLYCAEGARIVETVACLPENGGHLPERARPAVAGLADYVFGCEVDVLEPDAFAARVDRIREQAGSGRGLVAAFPDSPHAVTALSLHRDGRLGMTWRTWHAYPQTGELVTTRTSVALPPPVPETAEPADDRPAPRVLSGAGAIGSASAPVRTVRTYGEETQ